jgi:hypothetical protein
MTETTYEGLSVYYGDLHSHCEAGYGHGSIEDAYQNAREQLDFACVTAHAAWPDMPSDRQRLRRIIDYSSCGFERTRDAWPQLQHAADANNRPGEFISFLGSEWHSMAHGDRHIIYKGSEGSIIDAPDLKTLHQYLRQLAEQGIDALALAHHIGYRRGFRGINWDTFDASFSPVIEIMSMHGCAESDDAPYPYLHTMGPRDGRSTWQSGLARGHIVGAIGSTDHHSAHPGSYGHGRMGVWADSLTRNGIWNALKARRTYALTGDRIAVAFSVNEAPMGSVLPPAEKLQIAVTVEGGDAIDYVELVHCGQILHRWSVGEHAETDPDHHRNRYKVYLELGWGKREETVTWDVDLAVQKGTLAAVEPRFRGYDTVAPQDQEEQSYAFSHWEQLSEDGVCFSTRTWGNPNTRTPCTQGVCLTVDGNACTRLTGTINGQAFGIPLADLVKASCVHYLGGFVSPAYKLHRAVPRETCICERNLTLTHRSTRHQREWYYVRVRQTNGQWAWTSPIWVEVRDDRGQ